MSGYASGTASEELAIGRGNPDYMGRFSGFEEERPNSREGPDSMWNPAQPIRLWLRPGVRCGPRLWLLPRTRGVLRL